MPAPRTEFSGGSWTEFVRDLVNEIDLAWNSVNSVDAWTKLDGSQVTQVDLDFDATVRTCLARHFPEASVLSEEMGALPPTSERPGQLAIVDPIDGTDSLIAGRDSWWVSVGLLAAGTLTAGVIYQPSTRRLHDASRPGAKPAASFIVGMSPDILIDEATAPLRNQLVKSGAQLIETPHAAEKVAAVLEGRASAALYIPSQKSPTWHAWDLAAAIALAAANDVMLLTLDGQAITVDGARTERREPWLCAADMNIWKTVQATIE